MQERWEVVWGDQKKSKTKRHPNFLKGFLNSHFTFLPQNINADDYLCHSGMCDNSSAISVSPGRRVEDGLACNRCKVFQFTTACKSQKKEAQWEVVETDTTENTPSFRQQMFAGLGWFQTKRKIVLKSSVILLSEPVSIH